MFNKNEIYTILNKVLNNCKYHTVIQINDFEQGLTRFANSEIHQNVYKANTEAQIIVLHDKKTSKLSTNVITEESLLEALKIAEENLKFLPTGTYDYPKLIDENEIIFEDYNTELDDAFNVTRRSEILKKAIDTLEEDYSAAGILALSNSSFIFANSFGTRRYNRENEVTFSVVVTHKDGAAGSEELSSNNMDELKIDELFACAYKTSQSALNPITLEPGAYDVVLSPYAVADLLGFMGYIGFNSKAYANGMSCFSDKLREKVLGTNITIKDDYTNSRIASLPFDFEGLQRTRLNLIENGVLKELPHDSKTAEASNVPPTGHSMGYSSGGGVPLHMVMNGGNDSISSLIEGVENGLLIKNFHYTNPVDRKAGLITGLTRNGLFKIENGKVISAVNNMRFTDSLINVFSNIDGITTELFKVDGYLVPAVRVRGFHITGKTS